MVNSESGKVNLEGSVVGLSAKILRVHLRFVALNMKWIYSVWLYDFLQQPAIHHTTNLLSQVTEIAVISSLYVIFILLV